jgi:hypothetical protein
MKAMTFDREFTQSNPFSDFKFFSLLLQMQTLPSFSSKKIDFQSNNSAFTFDFYKVGNEINSFLWLIGGNMTQNIYCFQTKDADEYSLI